MAKRSIIPGGAALVMAAVFVPAALGQSILSDTFSPVTWGPGDLSTPMVEYEASVAGGTGAPSWLNIVRDDGTWLVHNMPVGLEPGSQTMAMRFDASLLAPGHSYFRSLSTLPQNTAPGGGALISPLTGAATPLEHNDDAGRNGTALGPPPVLGGLNLNWGPLVKFSYHVGVPDLAQGRNQCGPTSAANSFQWLNQTNHFGLNMTTAQMRDELVNDMGTTAAAGTTDPNFVSGKVTFIQSHNLPLQVHNVGGAPGVGPTIAELLAELQQGQDIELGMRNPSHWVTLVGAFDFGPLGRGIAYNDPDDGKTQTVWDWVTNQNRLWGIPGYGANNVVDYAVAESIPAPASAAVLAFSGFVAGRRRRRSGATV